jgi:hypothetical protein
MEAEPMPEQRLVRDSAGSYHTPDKRFGVTKEGPSWWARDTKQLDELGQPHVMGPFATLDQVRSAIEAAAQQKVVPLKKRGRS